MRRHDEPLPSCVCGCWYEEHDTNGGACFAGRVECECTQYTPAPVRLPWWRKLLTKLFGNPNRSE